MISILEKLKTMGVENAEKKIRAGQVKVNGTEIFLPNEKIKNDSDIFIKESKEFVSRGAYKLIEAIKIFKINCFNVVALDIGSSTGGFTEILLMNGARKVYALDVGTNQLDFSLRRNEKVVSIEKTNLKNISKNMFDEKIELVVTDVSFISLKEVFKVLAGFLDAGISVMALIKPQYEAFPDQVQKGGIVEESLHQDIINKVINHAKENGFLYKDHTISPIKGGKSKNTEYISLFIKE